VRLISFPALPSPCPRFTPVRTMKRESKEKWKDDVDDGRRRTKEEGCAGPDQHDEMLAKAREPLERTPGEPPPPALALASELVRRWRASLLFPQLFPRGQPTGGGGHLVSVDDGDDDDSDGRVGLAALACAEALSALRPLLNGSVRSGEDASERITPGDIFFQPFRLRAGSLRRRARPAFEAALAPD